MASIRFVDAVCARTAMVGEDVGVVAVVERGGAAGGFPSLAAPLLIGLGFVSVGRSAQVNLVIRAIGPHLFI